MAEVRKPPVDAPAGEWFAVNAVPHVLPEVHGPFADDQAAMVYAQARNGQNMLWRVVKLSGGPAPGPGPI